MIDYQIRLDNFTGPLDLLLFFIRRHEIDIMDIPIAQITEEYLTFIQAAQTLNVGIAGEFLVMAATLMRIKVRMLLPVVSDDDGEELEDPRTELVQRLLEYKRFKEASDNLREMRDQQSQKLGRPEMSEYNQIEGDPAIYLEDISVFEVVQVFKELLEQMPPTLSYDLEKEAVSVREKIAFLMARFAEQSQYTFSELFPALESRRDLIATFIAVLELVRDGKIRVAQKKIFSDFVIERILSEEEVSGHDPAVARA